MEETRSDIPIDADEIEQPEGAILLAREQESNQRQIIVGIVVFVVLILAGVVTSVYFLAQPSTDAERVRDIFIIFMALQSLLIGIVLIILIVQLARLINLLQNEIKPILESTNETANTLRGTARFMSDHLAEPVIKLNEYLSAIQKLVDLIRIGRGKK